jgi:1-deoxy-D-xylulose-5-phosphate synthase
VPERTRRDLPCTVTHPNAPLAGIPDREEPDVVLERIDSPADLKALPPEDLPQLADELREAIVAAVARVGGHLGSNLGVVELTIALHRTFDSPRDLLVWDTGHQAYVHKMLTGRRDRFDSLRQAGGLSGYPSREESPHDLVENSHASTALSWAFGLASAEARKPAADRHRVVAVLGDGALTGGMAYEALNNLGHHQLPAIIVLNDNGRSYAETVSRLSERVADLRTDPRYRSWRGRLDRMLARLPLVERLTDAGLEAVKAAVSEAPALQAFVEALGVRYLGPYDGHDVARLEHAFETAARLQSPVLVHILTQKGKGYTPAETDPEKKLHDTSAFDIATGRANGRKPRSWTQAFSEAVLDLADEHPELVAVTAAMPGSTGLLPLAEREPDRVLDVGIAEQHAVTAAAGLAHGGALPLIAVYSTFFSRAFDQANLDVGLHDAHVLFVFDRAGVTGDDGASHHGILDLSLCLRIPTMTVLAPSCEEELRNLLRAAADLDGPVTVRFPKGAVVTGSSLGLDAAPAAEGLSARQLREGDDVCLLAVGDRLGAALEAADLLGEAGIAAAVWDVRSVRPADPAMLDAAAAAPLVVTIENGVVGGGAGTELADRMTERAGLREVPPVLKLGVPDGFLPHGKPDRILGELGLDAAGIAAATRKVLADEG